MNLKAQLSETFSGLRAALGRARLSVVEIVFLGAALLFAGFVAVFYFYKVQPLGSELAARQRQIQDIKDRIKKLTTEEKKRTTQTANAEKILDSLRGFESYLKPDRSGTTQIINEIDGLAKTHQVFSDGATYRPEEADEPQVDENGNPIQQAARKDRKPKIYPILGIDTTVIGDYSNLRGFISDLERSKQFLVINALAFQGGDDKIARQLAKGGKQVQLNPSSLPVSLKIEFDTYFKPPAAATVAAVAPAKAAPKNPR